ncbi:hypothetical protein [Arthrobacter sp. HY1533]|uniref:hypothetical protein n=1 Tax=Arthrobacter sp. HY1533 TaxID=2970919 RepID=UPI0022B9DB8F|nr:hypothetical protein [Arthrobacter sp. HY1533]
MTELEKAAEEYGQAQRIEQRADRLASMARDKAAEYEAGAEEAHRATCRARERLEQAALHHGKDF